MLYCRQENCINLIILIQINFIGSILILIICVQVLRRYLIHNNSNTIIIINQNISLRSQSYLTCDTFQYKRDNKKQKHIHRSAQNLKGGLKGFFDYSYRNLIFKITKSYTSGQVKFCYTIVVEHVIVMDVLQERVIWIL